LATIYYRSDNPFHQLDSAAKYITLSGNYFKMTHLKESYFGFTTDSASIAALADSIAARNFEKALRLNTAAAFEWFLTNNTGSPLKRGTALYHRDELMYQQNLSYNKSDSTKAFLLYFPESYFLNDYLVLLDKQIFEEQTSSKTIEQYNAFIKHFPANRFVAQAQDELFEIYKKNNTISELSFFVKSYPLSRSVNEAWKLLYALSVQSYNNNELQAFVQHYPEFPFKASINKEIELNSKVLIPVNDSDFTGFIDTSGHYRIPPLYEAASPFKEGYSVVERNDSVWYINKENENVFNTYYAEAYGFTNGMAPVKTNGKWYFINRQAQQVAGPFEELSECSEASYIYRLDGKYGAMDAYANPFIQAQFDKMGDFKNGRAYYLSNGLYGFVSRSGVGSKPKYQWISDFDENKLAIVKYNNQYGLIDQNDSTVLKPAFDLVVKARNQVYIVVKNNKYGFYSAAGCFISDPDFDYRKELGPDYYTNGRLFKLLKNAPSAAKGKQALMDANGRISIDYDTYEEVNFAQNSLIRVKRHGKYGFVDRKLNLAVACKYSSATDFEDSLSICMLKQESILINAKGEEIFKTKGAIQRIPGGYFLIREEEGNTLLSRNARLMYAGIDSYQLSPDGYLIIEFENKSKKVFRL
ncbi:MAG: WG repeat-containing protein, partial [Bacteroidia bacterium]